MEIGGDTPGVDYDVIHILGDAIFEGQLDLVFINGFIPEQGDTFNLFDVEGQFDATFNAVNLLGLPQGYQTDLLFAANGISVATTAVGDAIPEPVTAVLGFMGLAALALRRRRF